MMADDLLRNVIDWAESDENVRRLVLVGSRAMPEPPHPLSDIDVQVHAIRITPYLETAEWLSSIGRFWVCVRDAYDEGTLSVPTRLVIFEGGAKADFSFYPIGWMPEETAAAFPCRVLVTKSCHVDGERVTLKPETKIGSLQIAEEFFFEAWHVAVYLVRHRTDLAVLRLRAAREFLLAMAAGRPSEPRMQAVVPLSPVAAQPGSSQLWDDLEATINDFRLLAGGVFSATGTCYPVDLDRNISAFITRLHGENATK